MKITAIGVSFNALIRTESIQTALNGYRAKKDWKHLWTFIEFAFEIIINYVLFLLIEKQKRHIDDKVNMFNVSKNAHWSGANTR